MDVSIPQAGLLISAFAIGMVVGAPLLAVATLRLPRKITLVALISVFGLGRVAGALATTYEILFVSRVVSALASRRILGGGRRRRHRHGAEDLTGPGDGRHDRRPVDRQRPRCPRWAPSSVSTWAGGPRSGRWARRPPSRSWSVLTLIPHIPLPEQRPQLKGELAIYRDRQVWLSIVVTALAAGGVFCAFSYLAPLLTDVAGLADGWVPTVLGLFGLGALIGTTIGGRIADAHLFGVLLSGITASTVLLAALALFASSPAVVIALSLLLGVSAFLTAPALNARMFNVAGAAPTAGATTTAAFNLGNTRRPPGSAARSSTRASATRRHRLGGRGDDPGRDRLRRRLTAVAQPVAHRDGGHGAEPVGAEQTQRV